MLKTIEIGDLSFSINSSRDFDETPNSNNVPSIASNSHTKTTE